MVSSLFGHLKYFVLLHMLEEVMFCATNTHTDESMELTHSISIVSICALGFTYTHLLAACNIHWNCYIFIPYNNDNNFLFFLGLEPIIQHRENASCAIFDGMIYIFGGYHDTTFLAQCEVYDIANNKWSEIAPLSCARYQTGAAVLNRYNASECILQF